MVPPRYPQNCDREHGQILHHAFMGIICSPTVGTLYVAGRRQRAVRRDNPCGTGHLANGGVARQGRNNNRAMAARLLFLR